MNQIVKVFAIAALCLPPSAPFASDESKGEREGPLDLLVCHQDAWVSLSFQASPSAFFDGFTNQFVREVTETVEGIDSVRGGIDGRREENYISVRRISISFRTKMDKMELRDAVLESFEGIFKERGIGVSGRSRSTPPNTLSIFYETEARYGGLHFTIVPSEEYVSLGIVLQESPLLRFEPLTEAEPGDAENGGKLLDDEREP